MGPYPFVRKGTTRYRELMLGHLDRTALLNSLSCIFTFGNLLLRLASMMAAATAVRTTAPVPMTTGLFRKAMTAVQGRLLLLLDCLLGLGRHLGTFPKNALRCRGLLRNFTLSMLKRVIPCQPRHRELEIQRAELPAD